MYFYEIIEEKLSSKDGTCKNIIELASKPWICEHRSMYHGGSKHVSYVCAVVG